MQHACPNPSGCSCADRHKAVSRPMACRTNTFGDFPLWRLEGQVRVLKMQAAGMARSGSVASGIMGRATCSLPLAEACTLVHSLACPTLLVHAPSGRGARGEQNTR
eukprot:11955932-Alexandrium_andersonii.AAC.1